MKKIRLVAAATLLSLCNSGEVARAGDLLAAVLPSCRATVVNHSTTVFATIINTSGHQADGCAIATSQTGVTLLSADQSPDQSACRPAQHTRHDRRQREPILGLDADVERRTDGG
jgi:hypothetical protein